MSEIYLCTSIETDGPCPGPHSMLSLASAAFQRDKTLVSCYTANLETLPDATPDPDTLAWWKSKPDAWAVCRHDPEPIVTVMQEYEEWITHLPGTPIFVGYPAAANFTFVSWYLHRFVGHNPFGSNVLDLRSFAMAMLHTPYHLTKKRKMPARWLTDSTSHTYVALDDALSIGALFGHMLDHWKKTKPAKPVIPNEYALKESVLDDLL